MGREMIKIHLPIIVFATITFSCGQPEYSPWQTNLSYHNLTSKHLQKLKETEDRFEPFTIAISGDPQAVVGHLRRIIDETNQRSDIAFLTILGDLTDLGLRREWIWIKDSIDKSNKPILTVVGNHDGLNSGSEIYKKMFGPLNYSFVYKDVKFVMWNNNLYEWGEPNFNWLQQEVKSHHRVVVMSHQPPGSGTLKSHHEEKWKKIRQNPSVIASLHGHVHNYSFRKEDNLPIYTVDRVTGTHYGTMTIYNDSVKFENCSPTCSIVE